MLCSVHQLNVSLKFNPEFSIQNILKYELAWKWKRSKQTTKFIGKLVCFANEASKFKDSF